MRPEISWYLVLNGLVLEGVLAVVSEEVELVVVGVHVEIIVVAVVLSTYRDDWNTAIKLVPSGESFPWTPLKFSLNEDEVVTIVLAYKPSAMSTKQSMKKKHFLNPSIILHLKKIFTVIARGIL